MGIGQMLAYSAGTFCLGAGLAVFGLLFLTSRNSDSGVEGCLAIVPFLISLAMAAYFYNIALSWV